MIQAKMPKGLQNSLGNKWLLNSLMYHWKNRCSSNKKYLAAVMGRNYWVDIKNVLDRALIKADVLQNKLGNVTMDGGKI